jgi:hypothetical protein
MSGLGSLGSRAQRDRPPSTTVKQMPTSSAGKFRTGRIKEHTVSMALPTITRSILRNPYRTTPQGQRLKECSGVAPIPGEALAPRRARAYSLPGNLASIGTHDNHVVLPATALHVHRHTTIHSQAYRRPTRITIHCPQPASKFGRPALHISAVLGPSTPSHSV